MKTLQDVYSYLNETGYFYLSTVEGDHPKCRPLGVHLLIDGQLYFGIGNFKDVYKQMCINPKVEITASRRRDWIRVYGTAVFEKTDDIANRLLEQTPGLRDIYSEESGRKIMIFHLEQATAEFRSILSVDESFKF